MAAFVLSPEARDDLRSIREYIRPDSPKAARKVLAELRRAMERLAELPELGHLREDLATELLRFWPVYSYLIVYRPDAQPLAIVRVLSGYRDVAEILSWPTDLQSVVNAPRSFFASASSRLVIVPLAERMPLLNFDL